MANTAEQGVSVSDNLKFIVDNCVTANPELHPNMYYMELVEGTDATMDLPEVNEALNINLRSMTDFS